MMLKKVNIEEILEYLAFNCCGVFGGIVQRVKFEELNFVQLCECDKLEPTFCDVANIPYRLLLEIL